MNRLMICGRVVAVTFCVGFVVVSPSSAWGQVQVFDDKTAFVDATNALLVGIPDSETAFPASTCGLGNEPTGAGLVLTIAFDTNDLAVTQQAPQNSLCIFDPGFTPSLSNTNPNVFPVPLMVGNGEDDYLVVYGQPLRAIGFQLLTNSTASEVFTLKDASGATVATIDTDALTGTNTRQFVGFLSLAPVKSVLIDTVGGAVQNEGIDEFWVGSPKKICICHFPPGNPDNTRTICIGASAVGAHLTEHGDILGECTF